MIQSFSGAHPFRPADLRAMLVDWLGDDDDANDQLAWIVESIDTGACPRCGGPLPTPPVVPGGSRVTSCRCVPVCSDCSMTEVWNATHPAEWPTDREDDEKARPDVPPVLMMIDPAEIKLPPPTSGWSKYGFDDDPDRREREGR